MQATGIYVCAEDEDEQNCGRIIAPHYMYSMPLFYCCKNDNFQ